MAVIDSVVRLLPDVLGNAESPVLDSFSTGLLEHPQYTDPPISTGWKCRLCYCRAIMQRSTNGEKNNRFFARLNEEKTCLREAPLTDHQQSTLISIKQRKR